MEQSECEWRGHNTGIYLRHRPSPSDISFVARLRGETESDPFVLTETNVPETRAILWKILSCDPRFGPRESIERYRYGAVITSNSDGSLTVDNKISPICLFRHMPYHDQSNRYHY